MCTAISWTSGNHYFGRNLDLDHSYNEAVTITPRNYLLKFRNGHVLEKHFAMIGIATVIGDYPLYYDATNEYGLSMAGLNFPGNAYYPQPISNVINISPFEFIPWILAQCKTVNEARSQIANIQLSGIPFSDDLPLTPLHWMISDRENSVVIESVEEGLRIYDNPAKVLTNNPPFPYHMHNLCNYMQLSPDAPINRFQDIPELTPYSLGMGGIGLPGDLSSASRFIRSAFTRTNATKYDESRKAVCQFFHILGSVSQTEGCVSTPAGLEKTIYSSCCNTDMGIYYYTTYFGNQITAVTMTDENKNAECLTCYPLRSQNTILYENK